MWKIPAECNKEAVTRGFKWRPVSIMVVYRYYAENLLTSIQIIFIL